MRKLTEKRMAGILIVVAVSILLSARVITRVFAKESASTDLSEKRTSAVSYIDSANVQYITSEDYDIDQIRTVLNAGGIVVDTSGYSQEIVEDLGFTFSLSEKSAAEDADAENDPGSDVAALYYRYGDSVDGIYIINIGTDDVGDQEELIREAIAVILDRQTDYANAEKGMAADISELTVSQEMTVMLGTFDIMTIREPRGKVMTSCDVYTVQDYNDRDYYILKTTITGYPGCILDSAYESKYLGKGMSVELGTASTSVTVDAYEPTIVADSTDNYNHISISFSFKEGFQVQFGSKTMPVSVTGTSTSRAWDVRLKGSARKASFALSYGAAFDCPYNKSDVDLTVYATYELDSWNTASETICADRVVHISAP